MSEPTVTVDLATGIVARAGVTVRATNRVAEVIFILAGAAPAFITADRICAKVAGWQHDFSYENLNVQLSKARKVLAPLGCRIENSHGFGWRIVAGEPTSFMVTLPTRLKLPLQRIAAAKGTSLEEFAAEALAEALRETG